MAFRFVIYKILSVIMTFRLRCYICDDPFRMNMLVRLNDEEKINISKRRRAQLENPEQEVNNHSRLCLNCNTSILQEIEAYQADDDPTVLRVLFRNGARSCFVCFAEDNINQVTLKVRVNVFVKANIFIPPHFRLCNDHLDSNGYLLQHLHSGLQAIEIPYNLKGTELTNFLGCLREEYNRLWIDSEENFSDDDFLALTSLNKVQFRDLFNHCNPVQISGNLRYIEKKDLILFMCKLRQGLSDQFLKAMFNYSSRQSVSITIVKVTFLDRNIVPLNLGYGHITREEYINNHIDDFYNILYNETPENRKAISVIDATYIKI